MQEGERESEGESEESRQRCLLACTLRSHTSASSATFALSAYLGQSIGISMQVGCALVSRGVYVTPRSIICTEDSISIAFVSRVA